MESVEVLLGRIKLARHERFVQKIRDYKKEVSKIDIKLREMASTDHESSSSEDNQVGPLRTSVPTVSRPALPVVRPAVVAPATRRELATFHLLTTRAQRPWLEELPGPFVMNRKRTWYPRRNWPINRARATTATSGNIVVEEEGFEHAQGSQLNEPRGDATTTVQSPLFHPKCPFRGYAECWGKSCGACGGLGGGPVGFRIVTVPWADFKLQVTPSRTGSSSLIEQAGRF